MLTDNPILKLEPYKDNPFKIDMEGHDEAVRKIRGYGYFPTLKLELDVTITDDLMDEIRYFTQKLIRSMTIPKEYLYTDTDSISLR